MSSIVFLLNRLSLSSIYFTFSGPRLLSDTNNSPQRPRLVSVFVSLSASQSNPNPSKPLLLLRAPRNPNIATDPSGSGGRRTPWIPSRSGLMDAQAAPDAGGGGETGEVGGGGGEGKDLKIVVRRCFTLLFSLAAFFLLSVVFGLAVIGLGSLSESHPVSVPAGCRIVSSSVDIRSSKVCELGILNYKAKHVFHPLEKRRFRCHDDYYWASIFEVEYREYFSGQILRAVAEAPKEALPLDCRPSFGTAWLTKMKYKVNETYRCKYTLGSRKADLYPDNLFKCQANDPSRIEMIRRFLILFRRSFNKGSSGRIMAYTVAGTVSGIVSSMCFVSVAKILWTTVVSMATHLHARKLQIAVFVVRFRRACLFVAYLSVMTWLALQYGRIIGLKQLFFDYSFGERAITR